MILNDLPVFESGIQISLNQSQIHPIFWQD